MAHPLDRPVGSDLSYQVLEMRRRLGQLAPPDLDNHHRQLYPIVHQGSIFDSFIADPSTGDEFVEDDGLPPWFHRRGKARK